MTTKRSLLLLLLFLAFCLELYAQAICPIHNVPGKFTGRRYSVGNIQVCVYQCKQGHTFDVRCY